MRLFLLDAVFVCGRVLTYLWAGSSLERTSLNVPAFYHGPRADAPHLRIFPSGRFRRHFDRSQSPLELLAVGDHAVAGSRALSTAVRPVSSAQGNEWELEAVVPEL